MIDIINDQIQAELTSAYIYLDISNYYIEENLDGFGNWFKKQAEEEVEHAEKFISYLHANNEKVNLKPIEAPKNTYKNHREPLVVQLEHEQLVTSLIYKILDLAIKEKDYRSQEFLKWYVNEQFEEEEQSQDLLEKYDFCSREVAALLALDKELSKRD